MTDVQPDPQTIETELTVWLVMDGASPLPVSAGLRYDPTDPFAVTMVFRPDPEAEDSTVEWVFARSLLTEGTTGHAGCGDVTVWPKAEGRLRLVSLALTSPSGRALFEIPLADIVGFLGRTYAAVPTGTEHDMVDLDAEIDLLLSV
jgi:hypothetical protein